MAIDLVTGDTVGLLDEVLPSGRLWLLEVGCGRGELAAALGSRGHHVTALEPDADAAALARERGIAVVESGLLDHTGGGYVERRRIAEGTIRPLGLRLAAMADGGDQRG